MKPVAFEARIDNGRGGRGRCALCADAGTIVSALRPAQPFYLVAGRRRASPEGACFEEHAPCPLCRAGFAIEFPSSRQGVRRAGPWGADGFWASREHAGLPEPLGASAPLPAAENERRLSELRSRLGRDRAGDADPLDALLADAERSS